MRKQTLAALAGTAMLTFLIENVRSNKKLTKKHYVISSRKIPEAFDGKKLLFLSDLHNVQLGRNNKRLIEAIDREKPDYILAGGDMLVSKAGNHSNQAVSLMEELTKRYPVYCGNGNHEERLLWRQKECPEAGKIYREYVEALKSCGVHHLYNKTVRINEGDSFLYLSGLELSEFYYSKFSQHILSKAYIEKRLGTCERDSFHILLAHNPSYFETYADWGADLTLSGHFHGGIVRLPFIGGVIAPSYRLFPKYDAGLFRIGKKRMIVSTGLGSHSIKLRLFNPPKIDIITLEREERVIRP